MPGAFVAAGAFAGGEAGGAFVAPGGRRGGDRFTSSSNCFCCAGVSCSRISSRASVIVLRIRFWLSVMIFWMASCSSGARRNSSSSCCKNCRFNISGRRADLDAAWPWILVCELGLTEAAGESGRREGLKRE